MTENRISSAMVTVLAIRLAQEPVAETIAALAEQIRTSPGFYRNAPVLLDVSAAAELRSAEDFRTAHDLVRRVGLVPVGIQGGSPTQRSAAMVAGLPSFPASPRPVAGRERSSGEIPVAGRERSSGEASATGRERPDVEASAPGEGAASHDQSLAEHPAAVAEARVAAMPEIADLPGRSRLVAQPVRSGTQIYAEGSDLIVLGSVSAGAEVMADGHVHIYGTLRGRALAGARGDTGARIFCRALEAELVSVAGQYLVREDIPEALQGRGAIVLIEDDRLTIREQ